ncbi:hypothetical protein ACH5RR_021571 [Cinchona calisaya]|uniref:Variable large protein n=1 Tax=Cinchona calisaya TaxID=153742 RepID=A0ABD2ZHQ2_9GENT
MYVLEATKDNNVFEQGKKRKEIVVGSAGVRDEAATGGRGAEKATTSDSSMKKLLQVVQVFKKLLVGGAGVEKAIASGAGAGEADVGKTNVCSAGVGSSTSAWEPTIGYCKC